MDDPRVRRGTTDEMRETGDLILGPDAWEFFSDEQLADPAMPHARWTDDAPLWWREGVDASTGRRAWAPAQLVHLAGPWPGDASIAYATSNGLACGITETEARISGLLEAVERDAFMLTWYNRLSLPHVDVSTPRLRRFISTYIRPTGLQLHLIDMSVFSGIPTVLAVVRNPHTGLAPVAIGAASAATIERAGEKAATEGMYTRTWMKTEQREGNALHSTDWAGDVSSFEDHIRLFAGTDLVPELDFLTADTGTTGPGRSRNFDDSDPDALWSALVGHLADGGTPVVAFDLTSPDVVEAGARVSKVVLPGYRQLDATYAGRMLGGSRLREESHRLGLAPGPFTHADLNHVPHPFP
ncbi:YcaO-like family protein [Clavibacter sepedonicus]|uniref:YcaO-like family protein n=1 Tax=Clavibacter TaxID=1573 RepID=UPI00211A2E1E|nr:MULTISPECIES: YcaO-like family protein [Clavibacter]